MSFYEMVESLKKENRPFAIAVVIKVKGSASAKPGSKAIINEAGKNIWGWVGGGCAESFVAKNAVEAMKDGQTRIIQADLDDEIFGLGMPCGGIMDVYIEPQKPLEKIVIEEKTDLESTPLHLALSMGFDASFKVGGESIEASPLERSLFAIASSIARARSMSFESLKSIRKVFPESAKSEWRGEELPELLIVGSSRITEELARLALIAKWPVRVYGWGLDPSLYPVQVVIEESDAGFQNFRVKKNSAVMVASHHKGDHDFIRHAVEAGANYVGLIASTKRSGLILEHLSSLNMSVEDLSKVHAPAGLELGCIDPQEIALSCMAEIIQLKNGRRSHAS